MLTMTSAHDNFALWCSQELARVEDALTLWIAADAPANLGEPMRYAVLDGGKRLRPLLVLAAAQAVGSLDASQAEAALRAGCAVELIHAYSLVHDDMPCMDNDVLRRGKPTVHVQFGQAQALLAGDALQALAFEILVPEGSAISDGVQARLHAIGDGTALGNQDLERQRLQRVAREQGLGLAKLHMDGGLATAQHIVVHTGHIVMHQRIGVDQLHRAAGAQGGLCLGRIQAAHGLGSGQHQQRAQALAAIEHGVAHGLAQVGGGIGGNPQREGVFDAGEFLAAPKGKIIVR